MLFVADEEPAMVHAAVLLVSAATVVFAPAMLAHLPAVVGTTGLLSSANALNAVTSGTVRLVGGPLGAALLLVAGFPGLIMIDIATYLFSAIAIAMTRPRGRPDPRGERSSFRAGLQVLPEYPVVAALLPATAVFLLANAALSALLVALGVQQLGGSGAVGAVLSALGVGFLLGAPLLRLLADRSSIRLVLSGAQAVTAVGFAVLVNATALPLALVAAVAIGTSGSVVLGAPQIVWQRTIPGAALGRIGAVFGIVEAAATLTGAVLGPVLAQIAGLSVAGNAAALLAVAGAATTAMIVPSEPG